MSTVGKQGTSARGSHESFTDPVERADHRRESECEHDVTIEPDGSVEQELHGNREETSIPSGEDNREQGSHAPEHDQRDPALQPDPQAPGVPQPPPGATRRT